jgi:hypothetical protein
MEAGIAIDISILIMGVSFPDIHCLAWWCYLITVVKYIVGLTSATGAFVISKCDKCCTTCSYDHLNIETICKCDNLLCMTRLCTSILRLSNVTTFFLKVGGHFGRVTLHILRCGSNYFIIGIELITDNAITHSFKQYPSFALAVILHSC